ncbi:uncharacterized protein LOC132732914 [Ruditapes philippinarum]|uniref:uncharacterized protein LOC132732914 n=1 Tax=Ruditapes philippinarum TaxID=129788 RepID=UPI00295BEB8C|nr:uncharacterized protein LOC132732914 [Ruditapes philippinarum]
MDEDTLKILQETRDKMHRCREKYFWSQFTSYGWSFAGNIVSAFAAFKANTSPRLFTLLYILKHFVWVYVLIYRRKSLEETEREINRLYHDSMKKVREVCPKYSMQKVRTVCPKSPVTFNTSSHPSLTFAFPFASFLWDLTKRYRENLPNRNYGVLDKALIVVKRQKCEIEQLKTMLKEIYPLFQGSPCKVVEAIPGVKIPAEISTEEALLEGQITIQNIPVSNNPLKKKRTEIEKATHKKEDFYKHALGVLESAGICLQAREEAKVLPTFKLVQNLKLLEEANKNLDALKESKLEFQLLNHKKQKNQQAIVEEICRMLDNTTEALENVSDFKIDIRSELEKSRIQKSVKKVQKYAKQGYEINHQVENALKAMTEANKAMVDIKKSTKGWFSDGMQINEIKIPVGTENDWKTQSKDLADSMKLLGEHAEKLMVSPNRIMNEFTSYQTRRMTNNAEDMAKEVLSIFDQIDGEISNNNSDSQIRVVEQVFQRIWSQLTSTETTKMQRDTPVSKMRSKAQTLHSKVPTSNKLHVDIMTLITAFFGTVVDGWNIFMLFKMDRKMHPKEILIKNKIEEISGEI